VTPAAEPKFDPRAILAALERNYVDYVVIGGFARVIRGADEITLGVDITPSFAKDNLARLAQALDELDAGRIDRRELEADRARTFGPPPEPVRSARNMRLEREAQERGIER
jgi:hypothetical protein